MIDNVQKIQNLLNRALSRAERPLESCTLIAVSKTQSVEQIHRARLTGLTHFGENKVQEAHEKFSLPPERAPHEILHLIGPLQSNKVRQAMECFDMIHSVDRPKLVNAIARLSDEIGTCPDLFIQVNTGQEPQKAGVLPADLDNLVHQMREKQLPLIGLMCIPPATQAPAPHFAWLAQRAKDFGLNELSMGMSQDFEAAAELGATYVRVGSALFGERFS